MAEKQPRKKWRRRLLWVLVIIGCWYLGDFCYSRYVAREIRKWEASVPWTGTGLVPGAEEFAVGEGSTALLMVHGFSDSPQLYRKMAPALAAKGYSCRCILLPGFGMRVDDYASSTPEEWLAKLKTEAAELRKSHARVVIVAHSLGGALTIRTILDQPDAADAIVLLAPAIAVSNARSPVLPTRFWHEFGKWALPSTKITKSPFEIDVHDPAEKSLPHRNVFSPRSVVDHTFQLTDNNLNQFKEISLPTLVFVAPDDQVVDPDAIRTFYEQISSDDKQLVEVSHSGHVIPVDLDWEQVVDEIAQFLSVPEPPQ